MRAHLLAALSLLVLGQGASAALAQEQGWKHSGSIFLLTTPEGAPLEAGAALEGFPVLVRLHKDFFDFSQAKPGGEDLRFSDRAGADLPYQIEEWDAARGTASIWVRVPSIRGNDRQEIKLRWGNADAASASNGAEVFNSSNGFLSVWHMNSPVKDEVGTLQSKDVGTSSAPGMIGPARRFAEKQGVFCGDKIADYPVGAASHSSSAWFRAERPNATLLGWGNEEGGRGSKIRMQLRSPPHIRIDSNFSDVAGKSTLPMSQWIHVTHTYNAGDGKIYINGRLDGSATPTLAIKSPARLWIGGWYNHYDFAGEIDEVRVSKVARSPDWVKLEFENQQPLQTLTGPVVPSGAAFSVSPAQATVREGQSVVLTAQAGGAQKLYWSLVRDGRETLVAVDRFSLPFDAGRVVGDKSVTLKLRAIYPSEVKTREIPITIQEAIAEPLFALKAPPTWDGRTPIEVVPQVSNAGQLQAQGAGELHTTWSAGDIAVTRQAAPGKLLLTRAQNDGKLTVSATIHNGGQPTTQSVEIQVTQPARDAWADRLPAKDEQPQDHQFYARDDKNEGTLHYNGKLDRPADAVFLKLYADEKLIKTEKAKPAADQSYALAVTLKPGLIKYKAEFGIQVGEIETVLRTVSDLVCGDVYLINGQSNAVATDFGKEDPPFRSEWIRTFGGMSGNPQGTRVWGNAVHRSRDAEKLQIGYWGMELGRRLVESQQMPICLLNGAVGGTRIDQHQRSVTNPEDTTTIYGRLLWRTRQAGLTHGVRGILWHQGENDQGADGPTGGFGWETYRQYFIDLAAAWKQDYPNVQHYYVFQIWPKSCAMGINGSDNRLREVQRTLPTAFSNLSLMSTLGIDPPGGCHFPAAGYAEFARLIAPLIERDHYGKVFVAPITPANLKQAHYASDKKDAIVLQFDQPVAWDDALASQFYLDGQKGLVVSGAVDGSTLTLKLKEPSTATKLTYLDGAAWSQRTLLKGQNGIAALTFCDVPILATPKP